MAKKYLNENVQTGGFKILIISIPCLVSFFAGYTIFLTRNKKGIE